MKLKTLLFLGAVVLLSFFATIFSNKAASFSVYAPKLLRFEGKGYGIHKPIWGHREFSKSEALFIHRHYYWNKYHGNDFVNQHVAEVLIDHLINAGVGQNKANIKAFERIVGVQPDGILTAEDVAAANEAEEPHTLVNAYVDYRLRYYRTRKNWRNYPGWFKRAKSFYMEEPAEQDLAVTEPYKVRVLPREMQEAAPVAQKQPARAAHAPAAGMQKKPLHLPQTKYRVKAANPDEMVIEDYIVVPKR